MKALSERAKRIAWTALSAGAAAQGAIVYWITAHGISEGHHSTLTAIERLRADDTDSAGTEHSIEIYQTILVMNEMQSVTLLIGVAAGTLIGSALGAGAAALIARQARRRQQQ